MGRFAPSIKSLSRQNKNCKKNSYSLRYNALMKNTPHTAEEFYDAIAAGYDGMISFESRLECARQFIDTLLLQFPVSGALDIGCGTGVYTLALAQRGVTATGVDLSAAMLDKARRNARDHGLEANWHQASMDHLPAKLNGADLLLCMGNTLPHLLTRELLHDTLMGFHAALGLGGRIALHLLNYDSILARQERVVGVSRDGDIEYTRFYDFCPPHVTFNLQATNTVTTPPAITSHSTTLWPYTRDELTAELSRADFGRIHAYGGLGLNEYDPATSDTLLLIAQK
jgi:glycine/sarcosine N-methyltransferase